MTRKSPRPARLSASSEFGFSSRRDGEGFIVELEFTPNLRLVGIVRRFVEEYFSEVFDDPDMVSRIALTTHELMENAVKFTTGRTARLAVEVRPRDAHHEVRVRIAHPTRQEHAERLASLLRELELAEDPLAIYLRLMSTTATQVEGSGLGLARIRVEGEMHLKHTVKRDWVEVVASTETARH